MEHTVSRFTNAVAALLTIVLIVSFSVAQDQTIQSDAGASEICCDSAMDVVKIIVEPKEVVLHGANRQQQLLVTGIK